MFSHKLNHPLSAMPYIMSLPTDCMVQNGDHNIEDKLTSLGPPLTMGSFVYRLAAWEYDWALCLHNLLACSWQPGWNKGGRSYKCKCIHVPVCNKLPSDMHDDSHKTLYRAVDIIMSSLLPQLQVSIVSLSFVSINNLVQKVKTRGRHMSIRHNLKNLIYWALHMFTCS